MADFHYIAIEGVIGVGKTTLASRLSERYGGRLVMEEFERNPFLPDFYRNPAANAFAAQIFFLLSRYKQLNQLHSLDLFHEIVIVDYIFEKDRIFANINLSEAELGLYDEVARHIATGLPRPDIVIYLQADVSTLMERIRKRNRPYERRITEKYLSTLIDAYEHFFFGYAQTPLLVINTDRLNIDSDAAVEELCKRLERPVRGTEYYNPERLLWGGDDVR